MRPYCSRMAPTSDNRGGTMPKDAKKKSAPAESKKAAKGDTAAAADRHPIRSFLKAVLLLTFVATCVVGYLRARDHVINNVPFRPHPPKILLKDRPGWMSESLANKIVRVAAPDVA